MRRDLMSGGVLIMLVATAVPAAAQRPGQGGQRQPGGMMDPVALLLERADSLQLDAGQRTALEAVRDSLAKANEPHLAKLQAARGAGPGAMQELRPVMQQRRENNDRFTARALAHLAPAQRGVAERILERARPRRPGGGPGADLTRRGR